MNIGHPGCRGRGLHIVDDILLCEALGHQTSLIVLDRSIRLRLDLVKR